MANEHFFVPRWQWNPKAGSINWMAIESALARGGQDAEDAKEYARWWTDTASADRLERTKGDDAP